MTWWRRLLGMTEPAAPPAPVDVLQPPDGFRSGVEAFAWRVLVDAYVRILARARGRDPLAVSQAEIHDWLAPYHADLDRDVRSLGAAIDQARAEGIQTIQAALHRTAVDHDVIDDALAWAYSQTGQQKARKP